MKILLIFLLPFMVVRGMATENERDICLKEEQSRSFTPSTRFLEVKGKGADLYLEFKEEEDMNSTFCVFKKEIESLEKSLYSLHLSWSIPSQNIEKIEQMWWLKGKIAEIISYQNALSHPAGSKVWRVGAFSSHPITPYLEKMIKNTPPLKKGKAWYMRSFQKYGTEGQLWLHFYIARSDLFPTKKLYAEYAEALKGWQPY